MNKLEQENKLLVPKVKSKETKEKEIKTKPTYKQKMRNISSKSTNVIRIKGRSP